jgi:hypothetical protein
MASLVLGIGSSHSIMLMATAEDWPRFLEVDQARASYSDKAGRPINYDGLFDALRNKDERTIASVSAAVLKPGSGEIRNWIALGGAIGSLNLQWADYVPCYRSPAGTGTGLAFAVWE